MLRHKFNIQVNVAMTHHYCEMLFVHGFLIKQKYNTQDIFKYGKTKFLTRVEHYCGSHQSPITERHHSLVISQITKRHTVQVIVSQRVT